MFRKLCIIVLCLLVVTYEVSCGKKNKRRRQKSEDQDDTKLEEMLNHIEGLKERVDQMDKASSCSAGNVHFYFHGGDDGHSHQVNEDDQHVHVHIHADEDHHSASRHESDKSHEHIAVCNMHDPNKGIDGFVKFVQKSNSLHASVVFDFNQFDEASRSGTTDIATHVHVYGDLSQGCSNLGPHYDPFDADVDVGDLGAVTFENGSVKNSDPQPTDLTMFGENSIIGRSVVMHGDSGPIACCVIGWGIEDFTGDDAHDHMHSHAHDEHSHDHEEHGHHSHMME